APFYLILYTFSRFILKTTICKNGATVLLCCMIASGAPRRDSKVRSSSSWRDWLRTWIFTPSGMRSPSIRLRTKLNSVLEADGKPTSISLKPAFTSMSKKRCFFAPSIGSISAWFPSRRSVESQRGGLVILREGHCRSGRSMVGKGRYLVSGLLSMGLRPPGQRSDFSSARRRRHSTVAGRRQARRPLVSRRPKTSFAQADDRGEKTSKMLIFGPTEEEKVGDSL